MPGVAAVSPQLYLSSLNNASCCSASEMFLVAFDPATDFTVSPWLEKNLGGKLRLGEAVGGTYVFTPEGEQNIALYGYFVTLKGNLEPTGTNLDRSMFFTLIRPATWRASRKRMAEEPLQIAPDTHFRRAGQARPGTDVHEVAVSIMQNVPGVHPIESPEPVSGFPPADLGPLGSHAGRTEHYRHPFPGAHRPGASSMAANERRREMGVLQGAWRDTRVCLQACWWSRPAVGIGRRTARAGPGCPYVYLFRSLIIRGLGVPFLYPSPPQLLGSDRSCVMRRSGRGDPCRRLSGLAGQPRRRRHIDAGVKAMIELQDCQQDLHPEWCPAVEAVRDASLSVHQGEFLIITGRSGSGKTTLLNLVGGMTRPTAGQVLIDGVDLWQLGDRAIPPAQPEVRLYLPVSQPVTVTYRA